MFLVAFVFAENTDYLSNDYQPVMLYRSAVDFSEFCGYDAYYANI